MTNKEFLQQVGVFCLSVQDHLRDTAHVRADPQMAKVARQLLEEAKERIAQEQ